jgi:salicylate hydroxylase
VRHALVVGGGIGGVTAAIALGRVGWRVSVLERAAEIADLGSGITLFPNAVRALGSSPSTARTSTGRCGRSCRTAC